MDTGVKDRYVERDKSFNNYNSLGTKILAREFKESPYVGYAHLSPIKKDLRKFCTGDTLEISGKILDYKEQRPVGDAGIEVWHLSPGKMNFEHRAKMSSNSSGVFHLITDLPERFMGKNFQVFIKITNEGRSYFTQLSFNHSMIWLATRSASKNKENSASPYDLSKRSIIHFDICLTPS